MNRNLSEWGVTAAGFLLACGGVYAMWTGWDMILVERGWSLFIAGSVALSGGVVTLALGRVVAHLARLGVGREVGPVAPVAPNAAETVVSGGTAEPQRRTQEFPPAKPDVPKPDLMHANASGAMGAARPDLPPFMQPPPAAASGEEPVEVDRYSAGDATYIMMSDGSVEVHSAAGAQRYPSLAALRAEAESRQR
ncbi:MAG: hypothetical protein ACR650_13855 [Methylocystis sp.]|jgi:hypothetical protein